MAGASAVTSISERESNSVRRCSLADDAFDAMGLEARSRIRQQPDRLQEGAGDHRLEHVQLEMALARGEADRRLIAMDLRRHHGQRLGLGWVDLAGQ